MEKLTDLPEEIDQQARRNQNIITDLDLDPSIRYYEAYQFLNEDDTYWLRLASEDIFIHTLKDRHCDKCGMNISLQHILESYCYIQLRQQIWEATGLKGELIPKIIKFPGIVNGILEQDMIARREKDK